MWPKAVLLAAATGWFCLVTEAAAPRDQSLVELLDALRGEGHVILSSSDLVKPWMRVRETPAGETAEAILLEVLAPYGLTVRQGPDRSLVIVRAARLPPTMGSLSGELRYAGTDRPVPEQSLEVNGQLVTTDEFGRFYLPQLDPGPLAIRSVRDGERLQPLDPPTIAAGTTSSVIIEVADTNPPPLEELRVSASQYRLLRQRVAASRSLDSTEIDLLPDLGDDPLRAIARLPGAVGNTFSSKYHIRGGESSETLVRFDGLRLYNPFHLKDFHSLFSSIDPGVIQGLEVHTGGYPVAFGDRMSGVVDIRSLEPSEQFSGELSASFFNASARVGGQFADAAGHWLLSTRRGQLDRVFDVVDPRLGEPRYSDHLARVGFQVSPRLAFTVNSLLFRDDITLSDGDDEELARASYRDRYYWLRADFSPVPEMVGTVMVFEGDLRSLRRGDADQSGISFGSLTDERSIRIRGVQTDWGWQVADRVDLGWGFEWRDSQGDFSFAEAVEFAVLLDDPAAWPDPFRERSLKVSRSGDQLGAYVNARVLLTPTVSLDAGLRWDSEELTLEGTRRFSPRLNLRWEPSRNQVIRAGLGRYHQAQSIDELQISDGVTRFAPPQRADHYVLSYEHRWGGNRSLRLELFQKDYRDLRPRYENLLNAFVLLPELKPDRVRVAPETARARGAEASYRADPPGPLSGWVNLSVSSARDQIAGQSFRRAWDQRYAAGAGFALEGSRWDFSAAFQYSAGWPTTAIELAQAGEVGLIAAGVRNGAELPSRARLDLRLARRFSLRQANDLTLFLELSNALDRFNPCCLEFAFEADEEDGVQETVLEQELVNDLPLFPSLGISWRF